MKLSIIGTGYVGLVTGVCFSEFGYHVTCIDRDESKITRLNQGQIPISEPGLEEMVERNARAGRLQFTTDMREGVQDADIVFIAVGTPPTPPPPPPASGGGAGGGHGMPDLTALDAVCETLSTCLTADQLVVIKSTVPIGVTRRVQEELRQTISGIDTASNPEFLREGSAIEDFMKPDRIVIGCNSDRASALLTQLYAPLTQSGAALFLTTPESSELVKYAANSLLATKVAFINEIADMCEKVGANVREVARGIGMDKRIGPEFLRPGPGIGGSCFPKDTLALTAIAREVGSSARIIEAVIESNEVHKRRMVEKIIHAAGGDVRDKTLAILGLTFKPGTDDMRESPSLVIVPALVEAGATIHAYDPEGMEEAKKLLRDITYCKDAYTAMDAADVMVILTEWNEFKSLDMAKMKARLKQPIVVDLRNIYKRRDMLEAGFNYTSIGRAAVMPATTELWDMVKPLAAK